MVFVIKILSVLGIFVGGYLVGKGRQASSDVGILIKKSNDNTILRQKINRQNDEIRSLKCNHIDGCELIAWIENYTHNYEYTSPPTTGEIIGRIEQMMGENEWKLL